MNSKILYLIISFVKLVQSDVLDGSEFGTVTIADIDNENGKVKITRCEHFYPE